MHLRHVHRVQRPVQRAHEIVAQVGDHAAQRIGDAGPRRHHHPRDRQFAGQIAPHAAARRRRRRRAHSRADRRRARSTPCGSPRPYGYCPAAAPPPPPPRPPAPADRRSVPPAPGAPHPSCPPNRPGGSRPSSQIGVRDRHDAAAAAVADRAGIAAGAFGADPQHPRRIDPRDRAATGADGAHIDHRHMDRHGIFHLDLVRHRRPPGADQRHVGRGAAHVIGDQVRLPRPPPGMHRRHHARGRPRHHRFHRLVGDQPRRHHAAVAVHHQQIPAIAAAPPDRRAAGRCSAPAAAAPRHSPPRSPRARTRGFRPAACGRR